MEFQVRQGRTEQRVTYSVGVLVEIVKTCSEGSERHFPRHFQGELVSDLEAMVQTLQSFSDTATVPNV